MTSSLWLAFGPRSSKEDYLHRRTEGKPEGIENVHRKYTFTI